MGEDRVQGDASVRPEREESTHRGVNDALYIRAADRGVLQEDARLV